MLAHLIRKEILDQILSLRFLILSIVGALIIWLSLFSGYTYYQARLRDYRLAQAATDVHIRQMKVSEDVDTLSRLGYTVHKSPAPMSIFVRGLEPKLGRSSTTGWAEQIPRLKGSPAEIEPILGLFLPLDLGLVVQVVLGLFVLLFTYDAICGEKEAGTLSLTASFPVPRHRLLLGKFLGAVIPTLSAFGLPLLLGVGVVLLAPGVQFTNLELARLGLILVTFGLYLTALVCVGLLASCLTQRTATSFVLLLAFWVVTVGVLPRLSLIVAEGIRPSPSVHEIQTEKLALRQADIKNWRELKDQWRDEHSEPGQEWWKSPEGRETYNLWNKNFQNEMFARLVVDFRSLHEFMQPVGFAAFVLPSPAL